MGNIDLTQLENLYNSKTYELSDTAKKIIEDNYVYIINKKESYGFTNSEIKEAYNTIPNYSNNNDLLWNLFNNSNIKLVRSKDWGLYRNNLNNMGSLLLEEKKYSHALTFFLATFYIDISGMGNGNCVDDFEVLFISSGIISIINDLIPICKIDNENLKIYLEDAIATYCSKLPFSYYTADVAFLILIDALNDKKINFRKYQYKTPKSDSNKYDYFGYCPPYSNTIPKEEISEQLPKYKNQYIECSSSHVEDPKETNNEIDIEQDKEAKKNTSDYFFIILIIISILLYILLSMRLTPTLY